MSDSDFDMEERLRRFAASTRTPPLPAETAALPWAVQSESRRPGLLGRLRSIDPGWGRAGRVVYGAVRITATLAVAFGILLVVGQTRTGGTASEIVVPVASARQSPLAGAPSGPEVVVLPTSGVVDDVMASYVTGGVSQAEADGAAAVVVQLDTLGGSESSMTTIYKALENATIPTIVWVGPSGAKAASAGTFITLSAGLAYMADGTNIGAASPVAAGGGDLAATYGQTEADKVLADAEAAIRSIAQLRHPLAVDWAVTTVANAQSYTAQEALTAHGINGVADSIDQVVSQADGQTVTVNGAQVVVHTKGASTVTLNEDAIQSILQGLDDPNIAFILLVIGVLCVVVEFFHPTLVVGLLGAFALVLSFYGSGSLPLNVLGVALVILGIAMIVLEPNLPSHGLLMLAGLISFVVGGVAFYGSPGPYLPTATVAWPIIATMAAAAAAYGLLLVRTLLRMRNRAVPVGSGMVGTVDVVGMIGTVEKDLAPLGTVYVAREAWTARLVGEGSAPRGTQVKVVRKEGLVLVVQQVA
jgi:membrane-bound serine protease (ClpP class)